MLGLGEIRRPGRFGDDGALRHALPRIKDEHLDARASILGLTRKLYFWGLFVETDGRFRRRITERIRYPFGRPVGEFVSTIGPGVVGLKLNRRGMRSIAEAHGIRRRWWWTRSMFARVLVAAVKRAGPVGVSVGYTMRGEPTHATIMRREEG